MSLEDSAKSDVYNPQMYVECVTHVRDHYYPEQKPAEERGQKLFLVIPIADETLNLRKVSLCMLGLRRLISKDLRCDEFAMTSKPLCQVSHFAVKSTS